MRNLRKLTGIIFAAAILACSLLACELFPTINQTPVAGDYDIGNLKQPAGGVTAVTITPKSGKSIGARTIYYEGTNGLAKSTAIPQDDGAYAVTFDVAAASGWNAASGLYAGTLFVGIPTPVASDFTISNLTQTTGKVKAVSITPKAGKSNGKIKIYYTGAEGTNYPKSETVPTGAASGSEYAVTFDVAEANGWKAATGLSAGTLEINDNKTPVAADYHKEGLGTLPYDGKEKKVTVTRIDETRSPGSVTVKYNGNATVPKAEGYYDVTFDVAEASGWNAATNLTAGYLDIKPANSSAMPSISVAILGEVKVGSELRADVQKNFAGANEFQWGYINAAGNFVPIPDARWEWYQPEPMDAGKKLAVKVTVGKGDAAKSATSEAQTVPSFTFVVELDNYQDTYWAYAKINDRPYPGIEENGFTGTEWINMGNSSILGTDFQYTLKDGDAGKTIKAKISGFNQTAYSTEIKVPAAMEYENFSGRDPEEVKIIAKNVEKAIKENRHGVKDAILAHNKPWCVDFVEDESLRGAKIISGKLHILFSCEWYDNLMGTDDSKLYQIAIEMKGGVLAPDSISLGKEYSGNFEDIRKAKLTKPPLDATKPRIVAGIILS